MSIPDSWKDDEEAIAFYQWDGDRIWYDFVERIEVGKLRRLQKTDERVFRFGQRGTIRQVPICDEVFRASAWDAFSAEHSNATSKRWIRGRYMNEAHSRLDNMAAAFVRSMFPDDGDKYAIYQDGDTEYAVVPVSWFKRKMPDVFQAMEDGKKHPTRNIISPAYCAEWLIKRNHHFKLLEDGSVDLLWRNFATRDEDDESFDGRFSRWMHEHFEEFLDEDDDGPSAEIDSDGNYSDGW